MENLLKSTADIRLYAKVNADLPETAWQPYVSDAAATYLIPYLGDEIAAALAEVEYDPDETTHLMQLAGRVRKPLALFTMLIAADETAVHVGDAGISQVTTEHFAQADNKQVFAYKRNLANRGWQGLEVLMQWLEKCKKHADYNDLNVLWNAPADLYINSATEFQSIGHIDIAYSRLTFEYLRPFIMAVENSELMSIIGAETDETLREANKAADTGEHTDLLMRVKRFVAHAAIAAAVKGKREIETFEYSPHLPVSTGDNSIYDRNTQFYRARILEYLAKDTTVNFGDGGITGIL
jgi:hypothetical protein